jgi:CRAL/TRIO domain
MERAIEQGCDFITTDSIVQVHDYEDTSMISMNAVTRRASKSTIQLFADYYPELLAVKFFVNVPRVLAWAFAAISNFLSSETVAKFVVLSDAKDLSYYVDLDQLPERYGGFAKLVSSTSSEPEMGDAEDGAVVEATSTGKAEDSDVAQVTSKVERIDLNKTDNPTVVS